MLRHGFAARGLREAAAVLAEHPDARLEGVAFHLPMAGASHLSEVRRLMNDVVASELATTHDLGQPPHRLRAGRPGRRLAGVHLPPADRHRPLAR